MSNTLHQSNLIQNKKLLISFFSFYYDETNNDEGIRLVENYILIIIWYLWSFQVEKMKMLQFRIIFANSIYQPIQQSRKLDCICSLLAPNKMSRHGFGSGEGAVGWGFSCTIAAHRGWGSCKFLLEKFPLLPPFYKNVCEILKNCRLKMQKSQLFRRF